MISEQAIQIGTYTFRTGQRVKMLIGGMGCDNNDNETTYNAGAIATIIQIERYSGTQGLGIGLEFDNGIFNMFDASDESPLYPFIPLNDESGSDEPHL